MMHIETGEGGDIVRARASEHDGAQPRHAVEDRQDISGERRGRHQRRRTAVGHDVGIHLGRQQRVEWDRDDAGAQRAPERNRVVHRIRQQQEESVLLPQAERLQSAGQLVRAGLQLAIGQAARGVDEGDLLAEPARHVGIDEVDRGVVGPALQEVLEHRLKF
jgi:hypothetical protein